MHGGFVRLILFRVSTPSLQPRSAGWYPDPAGGVGQRWHDGQGWTGQISSATPSKPLAAGFAKLADWLYRLLVFDCVLSLVALPLMLWTRSPRGYVPVMSQPPSVQQGVQSGASGVQSPPVQLPDQFYVALGFLAVLVLTYWVTGLMWLVWQHRVASSAPGGLKSSPAMHVVWWFVPFANWWKPVGSISDLWRSYGSSRQGVGSPAEPVTAPPVFLWWTCWLVAGMFGGLTYVAVLGGSLLQQTPTLTMLAAVGAIAQALAAGLGALVVRQLSWVALLTHADAT